MTVERVPAQADDGAWNEEGGTARAGGLRAAAVVLAAGLAVLALGAWTALARGRGEAAPLTAADRDEATAAVQRFASLSAHLRGSGGDPRFAERLPADPDVVEELSAEIAFSREAGRREEPRLVRAEVLSLEASGAEGAVARVREFWITRTAGAPGAPRSDVVTLRYELRRDVAGWRVAAWDVVDAWPAPAAAAVR